jgi:phosphoserine phosphatase RsbU/P
MTTIPPLAPPQPLPALLPGVSPLPVARRGWQRRLDADLAAAADVQRAFLPALELHVAGVEIAAESRPAYEVGGDVYDVGLRAGRMTFVVGDVAGKGVTAALIMARVSGEVRRHVAAGRRPRRILAGLNGWLDRQALSDRFVTATAIELDLDHGLWTTANAGHPPALLLRRNGTVLLLGEAGGPGLGLGGIARWQCPDQQVAAEPGDVLLALTDGFADRIATEDLLALLALGQRVHRDPRDGAGLPIAELPRRLFDWLTSLPGEPDDATLLAVRLGSSAFGGRC